MVINPSRKKKILADVGFDASQAPPKWYIGDVIDSGPDKKK
jgi:hypothetical protein